MDKYRLIKEYPGCKIKVGDCIESKVGDHHDLSYSIPSKVFHLFKKSEVKKYPEFWEKVEELDYEILSFRINGSLFITSMVDSKGNKTGKFGTDKEFDYCLKNYSIHSIKRLSDGEVFTVGDKVDGFDLGATTISTIKLQENKCKIGLRDVGIIELKNCTKWIVPLFTTEDEVDIFEGDKFWAVGCSYIVTCHSKLFSSRNDIVYFSTRQAAQAYIDENKPKYSEKDMIQFGGYAKNYCTPNKVKEAFKTWKGKNE